MNLEEPEEPISLKARASERRYWGKYVPVDEKPRVGNLRQFTYTFVNPEDADIPLEIYTTKQGYLQLVAFMHVWLLLPDMVYGNVHFHDGVIEALWAPPGSRALHNTSTRKRKPR